MLDPFARFCLAILCAAAVSVLACDVSTAEIADSGSLDGGPGLADVMLLDTAERDAGRGDAARPDALSPDAATAGDRAIADLAAAGDGVAVDAQSGADALAALDAGGRDGGAFAQPGFAQPPLPDDVSRAWTYVRTHEPFVSGLVVVMGEVTPAIIDRYFDDFGATAVHFWADGLGAPLASWQQQREVPFVSWVMDDGRSSSNGQDLGGMLADPPGRIGYQVGDEPRDQAGFDAMRAGLDVIRRDDPDALVIFNWTYQADALLPSFFQTAAQDWGVDIFSYDTYSTSRNVYERYAQFAAPCRQFDMPCWRYLDSYWDDGHEDDLDEIDMRWDAMTGLVYGYTGHTWFVYQISDRHNGLHSTLFDANNTWSAQPTPKFAWAAAINRQLRVLGESFNQLTSLDARFAYHWPSVPAVGVPFALPDNTPTWEPGAGGDPYLQVVGCPEGEADMDIPIGFFVDGFGSRYIAVLNGRHPGGSWPVDNGDAGTVRLVFDFGAAPAEIERDKVYALDDDNVQVVALPLTDLGSGQRELLLPLAAAELRLLKYANGRPFARRAP